MEEKFLDHKLPEEHVAVAKTKFYQQVFDCWYLIKNCKPSTRNEILNEYILYNKFIKKGGKCLDVTILRDKEAHMKLKLADIIDLNGKILDYENLIKKIPLKVTVLDYYGLINAIPKQWLKTLSSKHSTEGVQHISLHINGVLKLMCNIKNQDIYWELMSTTVELPTAVNIWCDLFPFLETCSWEDIFERIFSVTQESYLQSFQYKIINRIINCRYYPFKWKIVESPTCIYCSDKRVDKLEHHLVYCKSSASFWQELKNWLRHNLRIVFELATCDILLGIPSHNDLNLRIVNFLILHGKNYINNQKSKNDNFIFQPFCLI